MTTPGGDQPRSSSSWFRRRTSDPEALSKLLQQDLPETAAGIPVRISFGLGGLLRIIGYFLGPLITFAVLHFIFDFRSTLALFLGVVSVMLELAAALPYFDNLNRGITISAEGARIEKLHRSYLIPWWQVRKVEAAPDLSRLRIVGPDAQITFATASLQPQVVEELVLAIRAHLSEQGLDVVEMTRRERLKETAIPTVCHVVAGVLFVVGFYLTLPGTLGMRCSVNSEYLQERYGTPDQAGCVVLRVSAGASDAGVEVGDLLVEFEGYPITSGQQFSAIFDQSNKPWDVTVVRRGEPQPLHFEVDGGWGETFTEKQGDPIFYYLRARWNADDHPTDAIADYTRAIELDQDFDLAYLYRGQLYADRGDDAAAQEDMERALELSPDLAEAHSIYSYFIEDAGVSRSHIQQAIGLDNCEGAFEGMNIDCATHYLHLGFLQLSTEPAQAVSTAEQAIRFHDEFAFPYFVAACGLSRIGQFDEAKEYAEEYLGFPESERMEDATRAARIIRDEEGVC